MTRGSNRWNAKDLRQVFPLPRERHAAPRSDGEYRAADGAEVIRFRPDGELVWDGENGSWRMHGSVLHVAAAGRQGEGAIDAEAVYLLTGSGSGRQGRDESLLVFTPQS